MLRKKAIKIGILVASTIITSALLIGCEPEPDKVTTIHISPLSEQVNVVGTEEIPVEEDEALSKVNDIISNITDKTEKTEEVEGEEETDETSEVPEYETNDSLVKVSVVRVVDGDTYVVNLNGSDTKIRLIGVDTPESVASDEYLEASGKENTKEGKDISNIMKEKLTAGTTLFLEFDVEKYDKYDRVLAYAYFEDGEMVQEYLLKNGYAKVMTIEPNVAHSDRFVALEQKAMSNGVGIWEDYEDLFEK